MRLRMIGSRCQVGSDGDNSANGNVRHRYRRCAHPAPLALGLRSHLTVSSRQQRQLDGAERVGLTDWFEVVAVAKPVDSARA